jgi:DUF4097 and DUF4098 domain-containing protein YvlB
MKRVALQMLVAGALLVGLGSGVLASEGSRSKVNGSIEIRDGETAGDVDTVNGDVRIGARATVQTAETVNGSIRLDAGAKARSLETVNGDIEVRDAGRVEGDASSVNGKLEIETGAEIGGDLENVNGRIRVDGARVKGRVKTVGGDIEIGAGAKVDGGILVEKPNQWGWGGSKSRAPRVVIGPNAVVNGELVFEREVELFVSERAKVGKITGATAKMFAGERP